MHGRMHGTLVAPQETNYDFVIVYDNGVEVMRATGSLLPPPIRTRSILKVCRVLGPHLRCTARREGCGPLERHSARKTWRFQIVLTSDGSIQGRGFSANFAPTVGESTEATPRRVFAVGCGTAANAFPFGFLRSSSLCATYAL
jgi:hypothetical protein